MVGRSASHLMAGRRNLITARENHRMRRRNEAMDRATHPRLDRQTATSTRPLCIPPVGRRSPDLHHKVRIEARCVSDAAILTTRSKPVSTITNHPLQLTGSLAAI
jgi:hypothetical protein